MDKEIKFRNEIKYYCTETDLQIIESKIKLFCRLDKYALEKNGYKVSSIYFDDYYDTCYYENENGIDPREKFRIRIYNNSFSDILLESKMKCKGMTYKQSCTLTKDEYRMLLYNEECKDIDESKKLLYRFSSLKNIHMYKPKIIVEYDRVPYVYKMGNVRITFDRNICASRDFDNFGNIDLKKRPIMLVNRHILEVKYDEFLPDYLYNIFQTNKLIRTNFSKYYLSRKFTI